MRRRVTRRQVRKPEAWACTKRGFAAPITCLMCASGDTIQHEHALTCAPRDHDSPRCFRLRRDPDLLRWRPLSPHRSDSEID
jgi:hypothetical protein